MHDNIKNLVQELVRECISDMQQQLNIKENIKPSQYNLLKSHEYKNKRIILSGKGGLNKSNFKSVETFEQKERHFKPRGLWYGIGSEWIDWVRSEMPQWEKNYNHIYEIFLNEPRILRLNSEDAVLKFSEDYRPRTTKNRGYGLINWQNVALDYSGIELNPYFWDLRYNNRTLWYSAWDIPSGCVWKSDAIIDIKEIK